MTVRIHYSYQLCDATLGLSSVHSQQLCRVPHNNILNLTYQCRVRGSATPFKQTRDSVSRARFRRLRLLWSLRHTCSAQPRDLTYNYRQPSKAEQKHVSPSSQLVQSPTQSLKHIAQSKYRRGISACLPHLILNSLPTLPCQRVGEHKIFEAWPRFFHSLTTISAAAVASKQADVTTPSRHRQDLCLRVTVERFIFQRPRLYDTDPPCRPWISLQHIIPSPTDSTCPYQNKPAKNREPWAIQYPCQKCPKSIANRVLKARLQATPMVQTARAAATRRITYISPIRATSPLKSVMNIGRISSVGTMRLGLVLHNCHVGYRSCQMSILGVVHCRMYGDTQARHRLHHPYPFQKRRLSA